jgi:hypothetical protein
VTPQARTTAQLRKEGWLVTTVETWKRFPDRNRHYCPVCKNRPMMQVRSDLWGFADLLALHISGTHYLLQVTDNTNHAKRMVKIMNSPDVAPNALRCLQMGMKIAVVSWAQQGPRGEKKRWKMRWEDITPSMISVPVQALVAVEEEF